MESTCNRFDLQSKGRQHFHGSNAELQVTLTVHLFAYQGKSSVQLSRGLYMKDF